MRVLDEEEARHQRALAMKFLDVRRRQPELRESLVFGLNIVDADGNVTVTIAMRIRRFASLVQRELDFKVVFLVAQIDEREIVEVESIGDA